MTFMCACYVIEPIVLVSSIFFYLLLRLKTAASSEFIVKREFSKNDYTKIDDVLLDDVFNTLTV